MAHLKPSTAIFALLSAALIHCGGGTTPEPESPPPTGETGQALSPESPPPEAAPAEKPAEAAAEPAPAPKREPLTDEQILAVTEAANTAEIDQAKLAQKKSKNGKVKKLAAMILADHQQAKAKQQKLVNKAKLTPADSSASSMVKDGSTATLDKLNAATGADFDTAYVDAQVDGHKKVLDTIDTSLMPDAKNEELKKMLEEIRPKIEGHLKAAEELKTALAAAPAEPAKPAAGGAKAPAGGGAAPATKTPEKK